jgi:ABC-type uncharacterized transport system permease subunit
MIYEITSSMIDWMTTLSLGALIAYIAATFAFVWFASAAKPLSKGIAYSFLFAAIVFHVMTVCFQFGFGSGAPFDMPDAALSISLLFAVIFSLLCWRFNLAGLGFILAPLAAMGLTSLWIEHTPAHTGEPAVDTVWLGLHVSLAILGDALLLLLGLMALAFLLQDRLLRRKKMGGLFARLPPLTDIDHIALILLTTTFIFSTAGMLTGSVLAYQYWGHEWYTDPRQLLSIGLWFGISLLLYGRLLVGFRGRRAAWCTLIVASLSLCGLVLLPQVSSTKHRGDYVAL